MNPVTSGKCKRSLTLPEQESSVLGLQGVTAGEEKIQSLKPPMLPGSSGTMLLEVQGMAGDEAESLSVSRTVGQPGL